MRISLLVVGVMLIAAGVARAEPAKRSFGTLYYPAAGNIHYDEGTVEMHVIWAFDSAVDVDAYCCPWDLRLPRENWHFVFNHINWGNAFALVGYTNPQQRYVWSRKLDWKQGEPHHIAFTWKGHRRSVYLDGSPVASSKGGRSKDVEVEGWFQGNKTDGRMVIGYAHSFMIVDEFRVSSIARGDAELAESATRAPQADRFTLLLDHCDGNGPVVHGGVAAGEAWHLSGTHEIVDGRFGKAIRLWTGPDWQPK